ncbi:MAG: hypothetical protein RLZZ175_2143 [Bacteroidota bacterium]|jgi:sodium-dependent phosphate cotransporter
MQQDSSFENEIKLDNESKQFHIGTQIILFILILILFLFSLEMMSASALKINFFLNENVKYAINNPFIALVIGLLITAIFQSSSTTTTISVVMVASGIISLKAAIPIVMGANIGTTITAIITTISHINGKKEFKKATSAAMLHHLFNLFTACILFPVEYYTSAFSNLAQYIGEKVSYFIDGIEPQTGLKFYSKGYAILETIIPNGLVLFILSLLLLFISIKLFNQLMKNSLIGDSQKIITHYIFGGALRSFSWGLFSTSLIHSSAVTTSFIVPIVATDKISLKKAFPFIVGANIGTTFTAIVAALTKSPEAMSIAMAHFLFNLCGMLLFLPIPKVRDYIIEIVKKIGEIARDYKVLVIIYVFLIFFVIPFILIYLNRN